MLQSGQVGPCCENATPSTTLWTTSPDWPTVCPYRNTRPVTTVRLALGLLCVAVTIHRPEVGWIIVQMARRIPLVDDVIDLVRDQPHAFAFIALAHVPIAGHDLISKAAPRPAPSSLPVAHSGWESSRSPPTASPSSVSSHCSVSSPSAARASSRTSSLASMRSSCVGLGPSQSGGGDGALDEGGFTVPVPAHACAWGRTANPRGHFHRTWRLLD